MDVSEAELLFDWLQEIYSNLAMVNYPYPTNFLANLPAYPVKAFCEKLPRTIPQDSKTLVELLGKALEIYTNYTKTTPCVNISQSNNDIGEKGWDFQVKLNNFLTNSLNNLFLFKELLRVVLY